MYPHAHLYVIRYARMVSEWLGSGNDLATSIRLARQIGVVFSLATIWAVYGIARVLFSTRTALTAAAFLAVTPYHAAYARIFSLDLPATFWTTVSLLFAATAFARRRLSMCVFAGLAAGIAAGTKYNAGVVVVPALFLCGRESWHRLRSGRGNAALPLAVAMAVCLAAFVGFAATNPQCLMQAEVCGKHIALISALQRAGTMESLGIGSWVRTRYLYQTLVALPFALGWPLYLLSLAGITMSVCLRRCAGALLLFTYVAAYFVVLGIPKTAAVRYCLPLLPVLAVFAAYVVAEPLAGASLRRWCAGLIAGVIGYSFLFAVALCGQYSLDDREQTASWLAARSRSILRGGESATKSKKILVASGPFVDYDGLRPFIRSHGLDFRHFKPSVDAIRATSADFIVVSIPYVEAMRRRPRTPGAETLRRLDDAELGFRLSKEIRPVYFGSAFYGRLDPGVVTNWVHGQIGFRIYERDTTALGPRDPGPPLSSPKRVPEGVPGDAERGDSRRYRD